MCSQLVTSEFDETNPDSNHLFPSPTLHAEVREVNLLFNLGTYSTTKNFPN